MNPLSAVCFILLSLSFLWSSRPKNTKQRAITGYVFAILVLFTGLYILTSLLFDTGFHPDSILFINKLEENTKGGQPNQMAPNTAACFLLAGISLLLLQYENKKGRIATHFIALFIALLSLLSLLGYLYQVQEFYGVFNYVAMALNTAICFFLFAIALLFANPEIGFMREFTSSLNGSLTARLLIPVAIIVPAALGLLRLWGYWAGVYSYEFGVVLYASITILIFIAIAWYNTHSLNRRDLLEREAENLLRSNEAHTRAILDNAPDAVVVMDDQGKIVRWNQQSELLFGWTADEAIGQSLSETIIPEEFREAHQRGVRRFLSTGTTSILGQTIDLWAIRKDGSTVDVSLRISPLSVNHQQLFIGFIRDITERKQMENKLKSFNEELALKVEDKTTELREAKELADKLIFSLPGVFYFFDHTGKFIRWNEQLESVTGYSAEEIANMHPSDFFVEEDKAYIIERIQGVFELGMNDAEGRFLTKSGNVLPYFFKAVMINYEGGPCLLGTGIDITELKKIEEDLRNSEQKYKLLFESNPLPMWMLSLPDYTIIEVNTSALKQYGYTQEEFLHLDIFMLRPDEDIERLRAATNRQFRGIHYAGVWRHKRKDGEIIYVDVVTHDIYYEGKPTRLVLANEVTEQYLAEEKLKESYDATRKLTEHLQNVREEERLHIAREIHDELGQLLTVLKMDVSWLNRKLQPASEPVKEKITELLSLIDVTVKKVRHISSELRPSLLDDLGLIAAMEWHTEEFQNRSGISVEVNLPPAELLLPEPVKIGLFRILQESLTNVARHSGADKVAVTLLQKENSLILTIKDNGKGFDAENAKKKTLGLLGMKERTLMIGGEYKITGVQGEGTIVEVIVPLPVFAKENR
ncbi:MAG: PAS domain-containing sensor histidine kinase [Chitinophagaceae bacterium]